MQFHFELINWVNFKMSFWCLQFSQKWTKAIRLEVVKSNFFVRFLGELKIPKKHFEINWPLVNKGWIIAILCVNTEALALLLCFYQCMPSYQLHCARRAEPVRSSASRPSKLGMELAQRLASSLRSANCRPVSTTTYCAREVI